MLHLRQMLRQIELGVQYGPITKSTFFSSVYVIFLKILFQFKGMLQGVDLNYQLPKCPYSNFPKALEFYLRVLFPCEYP